MMRVLSLFDGISAAQVALNNLGVKDYTYYASEIDKYAIKVTQHNYPNTIQIGDVSKVNGYDYKDIDLLIGGSPCQDLSIAKNNRKGLLGDRSSLFFEYVRILCEVNPKYFVLENVASMPDEAKQVISDTLGVEPVRINSSLLTAQMRDRLYWTNINAYPDITGTFLLTGIEQPEDKGILLKDILLDDAYTQDMKSYALTKSYQGACIRDIERGQRTLVFIGNIGNDNSQGNRVYDANGKSVSLSANGGGAGAKTGLYQMGVNIRKLHPIECERLQGFPDDYTNCVSNTQRYRALGNSFTVPVIMHILQHITKEYI